MSRIGKRPVELPSGVEATLSGQTISVKGPKGARAFTATDDVTITVQGDVTGVTDGFKKELEINGVGYRAQIQGSTLKLSLGYSHDVNFEVPDGVTVTCPKQTEIVIEGSDQQAVGQVAAKIREWRAPEPYKGKGIKYKDEYIFRKEGKR
jgi:large subunit ribosomal protein L6